MTPAEQAERFCSVLFADLGGSLDDHWATVWTVGEHGKHTRWLSGSDPAAIAAAAQAADTAAGTQAVYVGMGLAPVRGQSNQRPRNNEIGALTSVWIEVDIAGPAHDSEARPRRRPADREQARRVIDAVGLTPTMVWSSGHGLQACWCFDEPEVFEPGSARAAQLATLARNWRVTFSVHAHRLGRWHIDPVHDIARVLRIPGGHNRKLADVRPVELLEVNESARYALDDILAATIDEKYLREFEGMTAPADGGTGKVDLKAVWRMVTSPAYKTRRYEPEWLTALVDEGVMSEATTLVKVFRHGHDSGDPSSRDASLARCIADVIHDSGEGPEHLFDRRDAVELIMCARLRDGDKLDKVDPAKRTDYIVRTVDKVWSESDKSQAARTERATAAAAALDAQDAAAARGPALPTPPLAQDDGPVRDMGARIADELDQHSAAVVPDPQPAGEPEPGPDFGAPLSDPLDDLIDDGVDLDAHVGVERTATDNDDIVTVIERPAPARPRADTSVGPPPDDADPGIRRPHRYGTRTETQDRELSALSESLLGPRSEQVQIWRCQYRGRGAKQERRVLIKLAAGYAWPGQAPEGYVPGELLASGWYPASSFNKLAGWVTALRQDLMVVTAKMSTEEFAARFADTLVRIWEADTSGGSLATVTRRAMVSYLLDYPPTPSWTEAATQGVPYIVQGAPRWSTTSRFSVLVRWSSLTRHVRAHFAINVTPAVAADMAELSGSVPVGTSTQDGQWHSVRTDYLGDSEWAAILVAGQLAEQRRADRHGMHVVGEPGSDTAPRQAGAGS